jgi:hypothetical protein
MLILLTIIVNIISYRRSFMDKARVLLTLGMWVRIPPAVPLKSRGIAKDTNPAALFIKSGYFFPCLFRLKYRYWL